LLIGFAWAFGYGIIELINPGSFSGLAEIDTDNHVGRIMQLRYFSFATLTTLGFGDILPRSPSARTLATLEAVTGQIYLAVLIARLVGLHIVHAGSRDD
jgi:voltage-gated potassium channel